MAHRSSVFRTLCVGSAWWPLVLGSSACNWSDFAELEDEAPVVSIDAAESVRIAFGRSLTPDRRSGHPTLLVGGQPGATAAAAYDLGTKGEPGTDPSKEGFCSGSRVEPCQLADQPAPIQLVNAHGNADSCFAYAWGKDHNTAKNGIAARCNDSSDITLKVPSAALKAHDDAFNRDGEYQPLFLASDASQPNTLVAGIPNQKLAWLYPAGSEAPLSLVLPADTKPPKSYGGQLAVLPLDKEGDERLVAVAAPEVGQVYLFRSVKKDSPFSVGCLGEGFGFGRSLATGDVDGDGVFDLVVADDQLVTALSGAALATLSPAFSADCSLSALPEDAVIASFGCGSAEAVSGCNGSNFGASVAVGDLDGDGDGEIVVGAPGLDVYGVSGAGAVLVYDAEGKTKHELSDVLFTSDAEKDDHLGQSVATLQQKDHDVVAAGVPGRSQVNLFFCNSLLPSKARTGRCAK